MRLVIDENVSYGVVERLRMSGHDVVIAIAEMPERGMTDDDVYALAVREEAVLVTRDYHFTNPVRFSAEKTNGIIYIRHGNLKSEEEIRLVDHFLRAYDKKLFRGKLVTLYHESVRIR
jgi:predicted nuclease of predicted toxin-antitoxin system